MEKEFVPYEQALELKELGFNEPCLAYYSDVELQNPYLSVGRGVKTLSDMQGGYYKLAPLYQQAFRWFRDKYGLIGWVEGKFKYKYCIESNIPADGQLNRFPFRKYEEAELECLKQLIEIIKSK